MWFRLSLWRMIFIAVMLSTVRPMSLSWIGPSQKSDAPSLCHPLSLSAWCGTDAGGYQKLEGTHDFTGFTASGTSVEDKVRTITEASLRVDETGQFWPSPFQEMVSCINRFAIWWGHCSKIGNNRMPVEQIDLILEKKDRQLAGPTAAPNGFVFKGDSLWRIIVF